MKKQALRLIAAAGLMGAVMLPATAAHAVYPDPPTTTGGGDAGGNASGSGSGSGSGTLPFTGGDVVGLALVGSGLFAGGTAAVRVNRRRRSN